MPCQQISKATNVGTSTGITATTTQQRMTKPIVAAVCFLLTLTLLSNDDSILQILPSNRRSRVTQNVGMTDAGQSQYQNITSACPCIGEYLERLRDLGIRNGGNVTYEEWEAALCPPSPTTTKQEFRPMVLGVGPGTTATRSVALATGFLGYTVLHYRTVREPQTTETTREDQQGEPGAALILQNAMADRDAWLSAADVDYVHMLRNVNAVFDSPFPHYPRFSTGLSPGQTGPDGS